MVKVYGRALGAVRFLTVFTLPGKEVMKGACAYFPLAGWLMGGALFLAAWLLGGLPDGARAFILVAAWEFLARLARRRPGRHR